MKHLKIEPSRALFLRDTDNYVVITEMTKEDLLSLAHAAIEEDDFEMDAYDESLLPKKKKKIIYIQISGQLSELHNRRDSFKEEARNIYKDAYNKYCIE